MLDRLEAIHPWAPFGASVLALLCVALVADFIVKRVLLAVVRAFVNRTPVTWDNTLVSHRVFERVAHVTPALVVYLGISFVPGMAGTDVETLVRNVAMGYMVLMLTLALSSVLSATIDIYAQTPMARQRPLKGFIQLLQIAVWILGFILVISAILDRSPLLLLSGFGAMTAILLIVFKDTLLSLVASVQLTAQDLVRVGDWIEVPQFNADGDVIDVQLHTIKIQNWDKTISTIPTHRLIGDGFKNWRGMSQSGARRIKRAVLLDTSSIRFHTAEEIQHFKRFSLLRDYISSKREELDAYNSRLEQELGDTVNHRRLTNIGTFRAYALNYLRNRPDIHDGMTLIVRQLASGPQGLPLEIYCFTNTTAWADYEDIQSDIFDHLIAIVPEFGLRLFQEPSGADFARISAARQPA